MDEIFGASSEMSMCCALRFLKQGEALLPPPRSGPVGLWSGPGGGGVGPAGS